MLWKQSVNGILSQKLGLGYKPNRMVLSSWFQCPGSAYLCAFQLQQQLPHFLKAQTLTLGCLFAIKVKEKISWIHISHVKPVSTLGKPKGDLHKNLTLKFSGITDIGTELYWKGNDSFLQIHVSSQCHFALSEMVCIEVEQLSLVIIGRALFIISK